MKLWISFLFFIFLIHKVKIHKIFKFFTSIGFFCAYIFLFSPPAKLSERPRLTGSIRILAHENLFNNICINWRKNSPENRILREICHCIWYSQFHSYRRSFIVSLSFRLTTSFGSLDRFRSWRKYESETTTTITRKKWHKTIEYHRMYRKHRMGVSWSMLKFSVSSAIRYVLLVRFNVKRMTTLEMPHQNNK